MYDNSPFKVYFLNRILILDNLKPKYLINNVHHILTGTKFCFLLLAIQVH